MTLTRGGSFAAKLATVALAASALGLLAPAFPATADDGLKPQTDPPNVDLSPRTDGLQTPDDSLPEGSTLLTEAQGLTGTITHEGVPLTYPALVTLQAIDPSPSLGRVEIAPVSQTLSDATGHFLLPAPSGPELQEYAAENGGVVNFRLATLAAPALAAPTLQSVLGTALGTVDTKVYMSVNNVAGSVLDTGGDKVSVLLSTPNAAKLAVTESDGKVETLKAAKAGYGDCAYYTEVASETDANQVVGEYHTYDDSSGSFAYGRAADSDIGVAFQTGSKAWKVNGSAHVSNSNGSVVTLHRGTHYGRKLLSNFHFVKYNEYTWCGFYSRTDHEIRVTRWNGGMTEGDSVDQYDGYSAYVNAVQNHRAADYPPNSDNDRMASKSFKYGAGTEVYGVQLGATSGYSRNVALHWHFGSQPYTHNLFGNDATPTSSKIIYAF